MDQSPRLDEDLVMLLHERDGVETVVVLPGGRRLVSYDIPWGYDIGDHWAHVTTNVNPAAMAHPSTCSEPASRYQRCADTGRTICNRFVAAARPAHQTLQQSRL